MSTTVPARVAFTVTPHNTNTFEYTTRGLYIGTGGNVKVDMAGVGSAITFANVPDGSLLPVQVTRVYATDTTATNIVGVA